MTRAMNEHSFQSSERYSVSHHDVPLSHLAAAEELLVEIVPQRDALQLVSERLDPLSAPEPGRRYSFATKTHIHHRTRRKRKATPMPCT